MPADDEKFPLPERLFLAFTAVSRWGARDLAARPDGTDHAVRRQGCPHPLTVLRGCSSSS